MSQCYICKEREATVFQDCLIIEHSVSFSEFAGQRQRTTRESGKGIQNIGLCDRCLKKQIRANSDKGSGCGTVFLVFALFFGLVLVGAVIAATGNEVAGGILFAAGMILNICWLFKTNVIDRKKMRKNPAKAFCACGVKIEDTLREGTRDITVPLGEGLYADYKEFHNYNNALSDEGSKKIYDNLITGDQWKKGKPETAFGTETGNGSDRVAMAAALELEALYQKHPEGFLTSSPEAEPVRKIGIKLNSEGGMELMKSAHGYFSAICGHIGPGLSRNLEMIWDGIGSWRG